MGWFIPYLCESLSPEWLLQGIFICYIKEKSEKTPAGFANLDFNFLTKNFLDGACGFTY